MNKLYYIYDEVPSSALYYISGFLIIGVFATLGQGIDTMATLPVWLEIPPLPGDTIIVKVKKIMPEKRKIYSSLLKIVRREKAND